MANVRDPKPPGTIASGKITRKRTPKAPRPHLTSGVAIAARAPTFRELTKNTGLTAPSAETLTPFADHSWDRRVRQYDFQARAYIARALREPTIVAKMSHNVGTTPELVVLGRFLSKGYILDRTLLFQSLIFRSPDTGFRRTRRRFVADIAVVGSGGRIVALPVDGTAWHDRLLSQQLSDMARNRLLGVHNDVLVIPERVTYHAQDLELLLATKQL